MSIRNHKGEYSGDDMRAKEERKQEEITKYLTISGAEIKVTLKPSEEMGMGLRKPEFLVITPQNEEGVKLMDQLDISRNFGTLPHGLLQEILQAFGVNFSDVSVYYTKRSREWHKEGEIEFAPLEIHIFRPQVQQEKAEGKVDDEITRRRHIITALRKGTTDQQYEPSAEVQIYGTPRPDITVVQDYHMRNRGDRSIGSIFFLVQEDPRTGHFKQIEVGTLPGIVTIGEIKIVKKQELKSNEYGGLPEDPDTDVLLIYEADEKGGSPRLRYYAPLPSLEQKS